jgi:hypothetical protein
LCGTGGNAVDYIGDNIVGLVNHPFIAV